MSTRPPPPFHTSTPAWAQARVLVGAVVLSLALAVAGCGGGGSGRSGGEPAPDPAQKVVISGTVRNVSPQGAARLARADLSPVDGAVVEVRADLDGDGLYGPGEVFRTTADPEGFFALVLPEAGEVAKLVLRVSKPGYSEFLKEYEHVSGALMVGPSLSEGSFTAIDVAGVSAGPVRGGRVALDTDERVTLSLVRDGTTGRRSARVARGASPAPGSRGELVRVAFPLRGLALPAGSEEIYASVAYLDTVADTEVMPGGFRAEGEGDTAVDVLATYGASQIKLYDAEGRELMTDPNDRDNQIRIQMVIPPEAYETIYDEDPETDQVEIPLYYYDEEAGTWKLHKNAGGSPAYGVLEDNFGNPIGRADLVLLQHMIVDAEGQRVPDPQYAPPGAVPADVTIYGVGTVHHFTTWNCDRSGRSASVNGGIRGAGGKPDPDAEIRLRKVRGGSNSDQTRPKNGRTNLHTDYDRAADNLIKRLLDRSITPEERSRLLWTLQNGENLQAKQAMIEALRRYAENLRDEIASGDNELERGIRAIFNNKTINDAFLSTEGLDCTRTPDLCNGVLGAAAETVNKSKDAQKAVAFLMQIAVDSYNPSNLDFNYAADKGIEFLDMVMGMEGAAQDLKGIPEKVRTAKELAKAAKELRSKYNRGEASFSQYWEAANAFGDVMGDIKSLATSFGGRAGRLAPRSAAVEAAPDPSSEDQALALLQGLEQKILQEYEDAGGVLLGASRFRRYTFAYLNGQETCAYVPDAEGTHAEVCVRDPERIAELRVAPEHLETAASQIGGRILRRGVVLPDAHLTGGGEVGVMEYFDGTEWVPLPGTSDLGVDAGFIPVPRTLSFGGGTRERPMLYLGNWTLDTQPNVDVTGRILVASGEPARNALLYVGGQEFRPDAEGRFSGRMTAFTTSVRYQVAGGGGGWVTVNGGRADLGEVVVPEAVAWNPDLPGAYRVERNKRISVESPAASRSGALVEYTFRLYRNFWYGRQAGAEALDVQTGASGSYLFDSGTFDEIGTYYLEVTARTVPVAGTGVSAVRLVSVAVVNAPPRIDDVVVTPPSARVGEEVRLAVEAVDDDGPEDLRATGLSVTCSDDAGRLVYPWVVQDGAQWVLRTDNVRALYRWDSSNWECGVAAWASDRSGGYARGEKTFALEAHPVPPEVTWKSLAGAYTVGYPFTLVPAHIVSFDDRNGDLEGYEADCGNGTTYASVEGITQGCRYTEPGDYTFTVRARDRGGRTAEVSTRVSFLYPLRMEVALPDGLTVAQEGEGLSTIYELPAAAGEALVLRVSAVSDNGPGGYAQGGGSIQELRYTLTYRRATSWWAEYLASHREADGGTVPMTLDKPGTYNLTMSARDAMGVWASYGHSFQVTAPFDGELLLNGKTARQFAASSRPWVLVGEEVSFDVTATGPAGWTPQYSWTSGDALLSTEKAPKVTFSEAGEHRVRLELRNAADPVDRRVVREVVLPVYPRPSATFASSYAPILDGEVRAGDAYAVSLSFPEGQSVTSVVWSVWAQGQGGTWVPSEGHGETDTGSPWSRSFLFTETGTYQIRVTLTDDRGVAETVAWDRSVVVTQRPPTVSSLSATPTSGRPPLSVSFAAAATDPDARPGEGLTYQWFVAGELVDAAAGSIFQRIFDLEGTYAVKVRVTDASGLWAEQAVTVTALYRPPAISELQADPAVGPAPLAVTFTAVASDPDGTVVSYAWDATNDGTFEQQGASATFGHTYTEAGTYVLRLRVTDNDGKTAERTRTVFVQDPGAAGVTFSFFELRSDGFGPPYDFTVVDPYHGDELSALVYAPLDDPNARSENATPLEPSLAFANLGFYGVHTEHWGNPSTALFQVASAGAYDVGLRRMDGEVRTVDFPEEFACGYLLYADGPSSFGVYSEEPLASTTIYPPLSGVTVDGRVKVLALLGNSVDEGEDWSQRRCVPTYYGFAEGAGATLELTAESAISAKRLEAPAEGYSLQAVELHVGDGIEYTLWDTHLPRDAEGRHLIPLVPGADYSVRYRRDLSTSWEIAFRIPADVAGAGEEIAVDFEAVAERSDLTVTDSVAGDSLTLVWESPAARVAGIIYTGGGVGSLGPVPAPVGTDGTVAPRYSGGGENPGFYRKMALADFDPSLDLASPGVETQIGELSFSVDTVGRTLTLDFGSTTGNVCLVAVEASYYDPDLPNYQYRSRSWGFLTASQTTYTLEYAIPETVAGHGGMDGEPIPAIDRLTEVGAAVTCGRSDLGYEGLLREVLADFDVYGFSYSESLADKGLVSEFLTRRASWQAP